ncbi:hypothetical protein LTR85_009695 [Meristemomyces frigidus]|nr:hypothetical protein LTR85_009695 [Meristemomyces frigidus]
MPPRRGQRGGPRGGAHTGRGRGRGRGSSTRGRATISQAGVRKNQAGRKRPIQPRVAAALASAVTTETETPPAAETDHQPPPSEWPPAANVSRIYRPDFMCQPNSLFFTYLGQLNPSEDTETIALNLMDHFLQAENFLPELWHGLLHAVCFLFAGELTGVENEVEAVAKAVEAHAAGLAEHGVGDLGVSGEGVRKGYVAVLERREQLRELVGAYAENLGFLAAAYKAGVAAHDTVEMAKQIVDTVAEEPTAEELFDFDVFEGPESELVQESL